MIAQGPGVVLIHAAGGGVGHLAVQIAVSLGATVVGNARASKHAWLRRRGADELIDYTTQRVEDVAGEVDVVRDLVGADAAGTRIRAVGIIRRGGIYVPVAPGRPDGLDELAARRVVRVAPALLVDPGGPGLRRLAQMADEGKLSEHVEEVFAMSDLAAAHRRGESNAVAGKLVLRVTE